MPFAIVASLLEKFLNSWEHSAQFRLQQQTQKIIQQRVNTLIRYLKDNSECIRGRVLSSGSLIQVERFLHNYLLDQSCSENMDAGQTEVISFLPSLRETEIVALRNHLQDAVLCENLPMMAAELKRLMKQKEDIQQQLDMIGDLGDQSKTLSELEAILRELGEKKGAFEKELSLLKQRVEKDVPNQLGEFRMQMQQLRDEMIKSERARRAERLAGKTIQLLEDLLQVMRKRKIEMLEWHIADTFRTLWRKGELLDRIEVSPDTFAVTAVQKGEIKLDKQALSAGEKELFALSLLAGLCKCADSNLPVVIDTPLGRLDSEHREHIVRNYYPYLAPQVILLSTDTEVTPDLYQDLLPYIRQTFTLEHEAEKESTFIRDGFFDFGA